MSTDVQPVRSRRAVLVGAAGAAAALAAEAVIRPLPAAATATALMTETSNVAHAATGLTSSQETSNGSAAFGVTASSATSLVHGIWGQATHPQASGVRGTSYSPIGRGVSGESSSGAGVAGTSVSGAGVTGEASQPHGIGVHASATGGAVALVVTGKASFSRCGRVGVPAGRTYADIAVAGGLTSRSVVHATLQTYRPAVAVAAVRVNYPSAGKARIYLTKVASTTSTTYVGWFVAEY